MAKIYIARSSVHGKGVFAAEFIPAGTVIGRYRSRKVALTTEHPHVLIVYDPDTGQELERRLGTNEFRYVNHSTTPNLEMVDDTLEFIANRHIAKGEELTWYYGDEFQEDIS